MPRGRGDNGRLGLEGTEGSRVPVRVEAARFGRARVEMVRDNPLQPGPAVPPVLRDHREGQPRALSPACPIAGSTRGHAHARRDRRAQS